MVSLMLLVGWFMVYTLADIQAGAGINVEYVSDARVSGVAYTSAIAAVPAVAGVPTMNDVTTAGVI
jgi:hypothetical protein